MWAFLIPLRLTIFFWQRDPTLYRCVNLVAIEWQLLFTNSIWGRTSHFMMVIQHVSVRPYSSMFASVCFQPFRFATLIDNPVFPLIASGAGFSIAPTLTNFQIVLGIPLIYSPFKLKNCVAEAGETAQQWELVLLLQRTQSWFPAVMPGCSQPPWASAPGI